MERIGAVCGYLATKVLFLPDHKDWVSIYRWRDPEQERSNFLYESGLEIPHHSDGPHFFRKDIDPIFGEATVKKISELCERFPRLSTGDFLSMKEPSLSMFQTMTQSTRFDWEISRTQGWKTTSHITPPVDSTAKGSAIAVPQPRVTSRRTRSRSKNARSFTTRASKFIVPAKASNHARYRPSLRHYLQCAWTKSVLHDTTYFILNCGRYEHIGFRHRQTQTLYLSGVIDTINIRNPRYRKLHAGLHIEIMKDALRRLEIVEALDEDDESSDDEWFSKRKRQAEKDDGHERASKRKKVEMEPREASASEIAKELATRNLLLVELDYDIFCSPAPSSFVRVEPPCLPGPPEPVSKGRSRRQTGPRFPIKPRCEAHKYAVLTLEDQVGSGAVGVVHPALVNMKLSSGETLQATLMLKLAFTEAQKKKLRNEYRIYSRVAEKSVVEGIVGVHGLFSDPESGALALLMDFGGEDLFTKAPSVAEKEAFRRILENIHEIGILHGDVRPNNLLIRPDGSVFLIDFDQGVDFYSEGSRMNFEGEWKALEACLAGKHSDETDYYL
ncbi:hypothetical protein CPC08DRAFT_752574 [Agrocybe pediades]|nr:hypothetical protein CPC08DRAFT_752574 [Agrocybe pediades]